MKVFEFHFNPRGGETSFYETFIFEPETAEEEKTGYLYMAGCLNHALPQNAQFLDRLATIIEKEQYSNSGQSSEKSLRWALEKANGFLASETKKENVSWLGNLNFAILSLSPEISGQEWQDLNFTKTGDARILLIRGNEIMDISRNLDSQEESSYPLKIFKNISRGRLISGDKVIVLSNDVFEYLKEKNLIRVIAFSNTEKELKRVFNFYYKELTEISGFCFFILLKRSKKVFAFWPKLLPKMRFLLSPFRFIARSFFYLINFKIPKFSQNKKPLAREKKEVKNYFEDKIKWIHRNSLLFLFLFLILAIGFYVSEQEEKTKITAANQVFSELKVKASQAEEIIDQKEANRSLQEINQELLDLARLKIPIQVEVKELQRSVEEKLYVLNKLETNVPLNFLFELPNDFVPQKIMAFDSGLYFYNTFSPKLYYFKAGAKEPTIFQADQNLKFGTVSNGVIFFTNPYAYIFNGNEFGKSKLAEAGNFNFDVMAGFKRSLYFLDKNSGEILKYPYQEGNSWGEAQPWLGENTPRKIYSGSASLAVDGNVWVLNDREINRYYAGVLQEAFTLDIFPALQNPTKLFTSSFDPYLYLLEPAQKRIIVLDKQGGLVKQFQNNELNNLKDFTVVGQTIYLLDGFKVYQINLTN